MHYEEVIERLKAQANPENVKGMAKFGIGSAGTLGVSMPVIRNLAKELKRKHPLAQELWDSGIHEARILACLIDDPKEVTEAQMKRWVGDFDSWDVCDQCCGNLFDKTLFAYDKAVEWSRKNEEFVKRAGFVLMASLAVHDKRASDEKFYPFFPLIEKQATDERNFVRKAVNWALRQIGKRNLSLNGKAVQVAEKVRSLESKSAWWIASDALRELTSGAIQERLRLKERAS